MHFAQIIDQENQVVSQIVSALDAVLNQLPGGPAHKTRALGHVLNQYLHAGFQEAALAAHVEDGGTIEGLPGGLAPALGESSPLPPHSPGGDVGGADKPTDPASPPVDDAVKTPPAAE